MRHRDQRREPSAGYTICRPGKRRPGRNAGHGCSRVSNDDIASMANNLGRRTPVLITTCHLREFGARR